MPTYDNEQIVRAAYRAAEGNVQDIAGWVDSFAEDGVVNNINLGEVYRGERVADLITGIAPQVPDVHRELHSVHVIGDLVAVELTIKGTFTGELATPAGIVRPGGAQIAVPTADFWYLEDGKIKTFNCYIGQNIFMAQLGINPDFADAVKRTVSAGS